MYRRLRRRKRRTLRSVVRRSSPKVGLPKQQYNIQRCKYLTVNLRKDSCPVDKSYAGPHLPSTDDGKTFTISASFISDMIAWFKEGKQLPRRYAWEIVLGAYSHFLKEESMVEVHLEEGMTCDVIGDVHGEIYISVNFSSLILYLFAGQFYDYLHLLELTGLPSETHCLLMNGDLVDRGSWSIEVILTALAFKCTFFFKVLIFTLFRC